MSVLCYGIIYYMCDTRVDGVIHQFNSFVTGSIPWGHHCACSDEESFLQYFKKLLISKCVDRRVSLGCSDMIIFISTDFIIYSCPTRYHNG